jgi:hypothetical protein
MANESLPAWFGRDIVKYPEQPQMHDKDNRVRLQVSLRSLTGLIDKSTTKVEFRNNNPKK